MRTITAIGGSPATGKTTLMRKFIEIHGEWQTLEPAPPASKNRLIKSIPCMYSQMLDLFILGKYQTNELFSGTDKLSMAVQPTAQDFVRYVKRNILFEGDRLFTPSFLKFLSVLPYTKLRILILTAPKKMLEKRYKARGSNQSETFLKGRDTKYKNIAEDRELIPFVTRMSNTTLEEQSKIVNFLCLK